VAEARAALAKDLFVLVVPEFCCPMGTALELLDENSCDAFGQPARGHASCRPRNGNIRGLPTGADEYVGKPLIRGTWSRAPASWCAWRRRVPSTEETVLLSSRQITFREEFEVGLGRRLLRVLVAGAGRRACVSRDLRPTAIVVDGVLPGIDGATVIRRIRSTRPAGPALFASDRFG